MKDALALLVVAITLTLGSCQSTMRYQPPNGSSAQLSLFVDADFDRVWEAVIQEFAETTTQIETIEKVSGFVAAARSIELKNLESLPEWTDLGVIGSYWATEYVRATQGSASARVRYNVFVTKHGPGQQVRVNTTWFGVAAVTSMGTPPVVLYNLEGISKGVFERGLLTRLADRLKDFSPRVEVTKEFVASTYAKPPRRRNESDAGEWTSPAYIGPAK